MKKGIIIEINHDYVTMLTPDGGFEKARKKDQAYEIGQEVVFMPFDEKNQQNNFLTIKKWRRFIISGIVAAMLLLAFIPYYNSYQVYAYMTIDINPSFELEINDQFNVIDIDPLNQEADKIISDLSNWRKKPLNQVTEKIVLISENYGYFEKQSKQVLIATVVTSQKNERKEMLQKEVIQLKDSLMKEQVDVTTVTANLETRKQAKENGISIGKMVQLQQGKQNGKQKHKDDNHDKEDHKKHKKAKKEQEKERKKKAKEQRKEQKEKIKEERKSQREEKKKYKKETKEERKQRKKEEKQERKEKKKELKEKSDNKKNKDKENMNEK